MRLDDVVRVSLRLPGGDALTDSMPDPSVSDTVFEARVEALLRGVIDMLSLSPRRYFFEVASRFTSIGACAVLLDANSHRVDAVDHSTCGRDRPRGET